MYLVVEVFVDVFLGSLCTFSGILMRYWLSVTSTSSPAASIRISIVFKLVVLQVSLKFFSSSQRNKAQLYDCTLARLRQSWLYTRLPRRPHCLGQSRAGLRLKCASNRWAGKRPWRHGGPPVAQGTFGSKTSDIFPQIWTVALMSWLNWGRKVAMLTSIVRVEFLICQFEFDQVWTGANSAKRQESSLLINLYASDAFWSNSILSWKNCVAVAWILPLNLNVECIKQAKSVRDDGRIPATLNLLLKNCIRLLPIRIFLV